MRFTSKYLMLLLALTVAFTACKKDDDGGSTDNGSGGSNPVEEEPVELTVLSSGTSIDGASKETGTPPAPSVTLDFAVATEERDGFQSTGFTIPLTAGTDVAGVYVQFQDSDNNLSDFYYNVPATVYTEQFKPFGEDTKHKGALAKTAEDDDFESEIEVVFDETVPAGEFCYIICPYDASGNVGDAITVCVQVEAWGGNNDIVGVWTFDREEGDDLGDDNETVYCDNGTDSVVAAYSNLTKDVWTFALNSDGSYYEEYDTEGEYLDYTQTATNCSATYGATETENDRYTGNWAYDEEAGTLTVVDFAYEDLISGDSETYGEGSLYFEGVSASVVNGELILTETYTEDGVTKSHSVIFTK